MLTCRNLTVLLAAAAVSLGAYADPKQEDAQIRAEVQKQINESPSLKFHNISVRSVDHVVYLQGLVDTRVDRNQAGAIARAVPGVKKVYNELALNGN
jgi:osmotically-inducible protein OsmY